jgi:hypothetical protein
MDAVLTHAHTDHPQKNYAMSANGMLGLTRKKNYYGIFSCQMVQAAEIRPFL